MFKFRLSIISIVITSLIVYTYFRWYIWFVLMIQSCTLLAL